MGMLTLHAYGVGRLQDLLNLLNDAGDMTIDQIRAEIAGYIQAAVAVEAKNESKPGRRTTAKRAVRQAQRITCPDPGCDGAVTLHRVNISRCTMIGGPWKTQGICNKCGRERYSVLAVGEIIERGQM